MRKSGAPGAASAVPSHCRQTPSSFVGSGGTGARLATDRAQGSTWGLSFAVNLRPLRAVLECLGFALMCPTKPPRPDRRAPSGQATIVEFHSNDGPRFAKQGSDAIIK